MGKPITIGQSHTAMSVLANNVDWGALDTETLQRVINDPTTAGAQFTAFLKNGGRVIVGESKVIPIDRTKPFDLAMLKGEGWTIWKGSANDDGLEGDEEQDRRSLALTQVDLTAVRLKTMPGGPETLVTRETNLKRLKKAGDVRLDAKVFQTLWENQHLIPEHWKEKTNGTPSYIFFGGTTLRYKNYNTMRHERATRDLLFLCWDDGWHYDTRCLASLQCGNELFAVLAS